MSSRFPSFENLCCCNYQTLIKVSVDSRQLKYHFIDIEELYEIKQRLYICWRNFCTHLLFIFFAGCKPVLFPPP